MGDTGPSFKSRLDTCIAILKVRKPDTNNVGDLFENISVLFHFIVNEKPPSDKASSDDRIVCNFLPLGPLASQLIDSKFVSYLVFWCTTEDFSSSEVKYFALHNLLRSFDYLISQAKQSLLFSAVIFQPLLKFVNSCRQFSERISEDLSLLLHTLTVLLCRDPVLLEFSKQVSHDVTRNEYFIFSCLVPFLHLPGPSGNKARDALLLILALSDRDAEVANYLTSKSDICPVLATGLSGHYSCLPKRFVLATVNGYPNNGQSRHSSEALYIRGAGWHQLTRAEWSTCEPLDQFLQTLQFCNLAIRISHHSVRKYLLYYIYSGFLMPVLRSALSQKSIDEAIAAEAYLDLFLRRLTEPALIGLFLRFIVASTDENESVLSSLITRLATDSTLGMVTLSLFRTILNLNCEDIIFLLVFRYLNKLGISNECVVDETKKQSITAVSTPDNPSWLASSERFLKLSFWCKNFETFPQNKPTSIKCVPSDRFAKCLLTSHRLISCRARSTATWSIEYPSPVSSLVPTTSSTDPAIAPLHSTPLRTDMTSSLRIEPDSRLQEISIVDRYKSESNIYKLSYCDDSDEEPEHEQKKQGISHPLSDLKPLESPEELELNKPAIFPLDVIRRFVDDIDGMPSLDAVDLFAKMLDDEFATDNESEIGALIPYPPISQFTLDMLDYRLGDRGVPLLVTPEPLPSKESAPPIALESDYDFESLYGNDLPELTFRPTFEESSPVNYSSCEIGPFLTSLLSRIGNMHKNCLYSNLLLTDIVLILASYHQFPLADFLLRCPDSRRKTPILTLYQALVNLRLELEQFLVMIPDWPTLVEQGMRFLRGSNHRNPEITLPSPVAMAATSDFASDDYILALSTSLSPEVSRAERGRSPSIRSPSSHSPATLLPPLPTHRSTTAASSKAVLEPVVFPNSGGTAPLPRRQRQYQRRSSIDRLSQFLGFVSPVPLNAGVDSRKAPPPSPHFSLSPTIPEGTRNVVFAYIVFNDFCLELASICCEHGVSSAIVQPHFEKTMELEHCLSEF